jgi:hypothetical protein
MNLIYVVEGGMLRILAQAVLENIEPFGFCEGFPETTTKSSFLRTGFHDRISREWLNPMA